MKRILLAEDQASIRRMLQMALRAAGFDVEATPDGVQCLDALRRQHPDLLITDVEMPNMSGKELCQAIGNEMPDRSFPIIVLTSRTRNENRAWLDEVDNMTFMEKPFSAKRLVALIEDLLASNGSTAVA